MTMIGFKLKTQRPPKPKKIKDGVVMRIDHVYEIDPERMDIFKQQDMPLWDTNRIINSRWEHLAWMHDHFADSLISCEELEKEIEKEAKSKASRKTTRRKK